MQGNIGYIDNALGECLGGLQRIDEALGSLGSALYFLALGLKANYWQISSSDLNCPKTVQNLGYL